MADKQVQCLLCPVHGSLRTRGMSFQGVVTSTKPAKTAVIELHYSRRVPKYERYEKLRSKIAAHVPECLQVSEGDLVEAAQCRKISKTKAHVVTNVVKKAGTHELAEQVEKSEAAEGLRASRKRRKAEQKAE